MIITTIETIQKHIATVVGADIKRYEPYLLMAEKFLFREILGIEMKPYVIADNAELLELCEAVVAHKAYLDAIPFLDLIETESGFGITSNTNIAPASPARVKALIAATSERLTECIEDLLEWLEIEAGDELEEIWKGSKTYTLINDNYVRSIRQYREYGTFDGGRLEWIRFRPQLTTARKFFIEPVISAELSGVIIEALRDDDVSSEIAAILDDLRFALAYFAQGETDKGNSFIARVRNVLIATPDGYPAFKVSPIYQAYINTVARDTSEDPFMNFGV